jgi:hypothetical protein
LIAQLLDARAVPAGSGAKKRMRIALLDSGRQPNRLDAAAAKWASSSGNCDRQRLTIYGLIFADEESFGRSNVKVR